MIAKKIMLTLVVLVLCIPVIASARNDDKVPPGGPFQALQQQIDQLQTQLENIQLIHPAVGAWFGMAMEDCVGPPPTNCAGLGLPAITFFVTASFFADGNFLGNDSWAVGGPPFGPHTTSHGRWVQTSPDGLVADVVFLLPSPAAASISGVHIKYSATVISPMEMVGYVNIYITFPPLPLAWQQLDPGEFPTLSGTAKALVAVPEGIFTAQSQCTTSGCPLVFRFTAQRATSQNTSP